METTLNPLSDMFEVILALKKAFENFTEAINDLFTSFRSWPKFDRARRRWRMMAPNGLNSKERKHNKVRLKGRRCK